MIKYYVYILKSKKDNNFYTGFTSNIRKRLEDHNNGKVRSTRSRRPFTLEYLEEAVSRDRAIKRERYFKAGFVRELMGIDKHGCPSSSVG